MTASLQALADALTALLGLSHRPIAIGFAGQPPTAPARYQAQMPEPAADGRTGAVPAGCVFWSKAESASFTTLPEDHANCSVGSLTHGLKRLAEVAGNGDVAALFASGWVGEADVPHIATVSERPAAITYGPLAEAPAPPDVVMLRLNAKQAMMLDDALGGVRFEGKPQCHIVAIAKEQGAVAVSVGCMLSRVRTGMANAEMTCAFPGERLQEIVAALDRNAEIERAVAGYAAEDGRRFRQA